MILQLGSCKLAPQSRVGKILLSNYRASTIETLFEKVIILMKYIYVLSLAGLYMGEVQCLSPVVVLGIKSLTSSGAILFEMG